MLIRMVSLAASSQIFRLLSFLLRLSFLFNETPPPQLYTLSLHDALPISLDLATQHQVEGVVQLRERQAPGDERSEEHTSELQSHSDLVCRLLLEKKNETSSS